LPSVGVSPTVLPNIIDENYFLNKRYFQKPYSSKT
jgi:hypothetical protein